MARHESSISDSEMHTKAYGCMPQIRKHRRFRQYFQRRRKFTELHAWFRKFKSLFPEESLSFKQLQTLITIFGFTYCVHEWPLFCAVTFIRFYNLTNDPSFPCSFLSVTPSLPLTMSSKFREHLSLNLPPNQLDNPVETSKFSPTSTIAPSSRFSFGRSNSKRSKSSKRSRPPPPFKDVEAGTSPTRTSSSLRDRFTKFFFDLRTLNVSDPDLPVQDPRLSQWPPLHIDKRRCPCQLHDPKHEARMRKQQRRSRCLPILLIIVLLFLIGNVAFLNNRVLSFSPPTTTTTTAYALSADAQQCLSQYTLNAPSSPQSYPCSTCLSTLQAVPSSYTSSSVNYQNTQTINNAVQFCGLRAIYETANTQGQATLGNGSWAQNVNFCTWAGVSCDASGHVVSL